MTDSLVVGTIVLLWLAAIIGWIMNIIKLVWIASDPITGVFIFRIVGVVVAPLGAILGYL